MIRYQVLKAPASGANSTSLGPIKKIRGFQTLNQTPIKIIYQLEAKIILKSKKK